MEPALLLQELPLAGAEKLGLIGALVVAVGLLWRRLDQKNNQIEDLIGLQHEQIAATEDVARALDDLRREIRSLQP